MKDSQRSITPYGNRVVAILKNIKGNADKYGTGKILALQIMKNIPFEFHKTKMIIRVTTEETSGKYSIIEMQHLCNTGPALHFHPLGAETFLVLEGSYTFFQDKSDHLLTEGQIISIPANTPHRYVTGSSGGRLLVVCPPELENYFWIVAKRLSNSSLSLAEESSIAALYGQDFLDLSSHWGHQ